MTDLIVTNWDWVPAFPRDLVRHFRVRRALEAVRPHTRNDHCWPVYFDTNGAIVRVAKEAGWAAPATQVMHLA